MSQWHPLVPLWRTRGPLEFGSGDRLYSEKVEIGAGRRVGTVGWPKMGPKTREQTCLVALPRVLPVVTRGRPR
jgi:hypothetical protein